jgi:GNAT superfamily N-acetyltransferase
MSPDALLTPGTAWCDLKGLLQEAATMSFLAPQRNDALVVRRARLADAGAIARVHVQSWREAYRGLIPQPYLDRLSLPAHERQWRRSFAEGGWAFVAEWEQRPVGFASGGLSRTRRDVTGELYVLYVLQSCHGCGVGRALFDACHYELARCGHRGLLVWVLADNPARGFYERLGGEPAGESVVAIAGTRLREVAYLWRD